MKSFTEDELRCKLHNIYDAVFKIQDQVKEGYDKFPFSTIIDGKYDLVRTKTRYEIRDVVTPHRNRCTQRYRIVIHTGNYSDIGKLIEKYFDLLENEEES